MSGPGHNASGGAAGKKLLDWLGASSSAQQQQPSGSEAWKDAWYKQPAPQEGAGPAGPPGASPTEDERPVESSPRLARDPDLDPHAGDDAPPRCALRRRAREAGGAGSGA
jgi:hypothetical protein